MNKYLKMLREIKSCSFATIGLDGKPQVRIADIMIVNETGLYFCTARGKNFHKEILKNNEVAILGMNKNYQTVRLSGKAIHLKDNTEIIDEIFKENPIMNSVYPDETRYILDGFYIKDAEISFFDLTTKPITHMQDKIGNIDIELVGYFVENECTGCGRCLEVCPQKCIEEKNNKYEIINKNCLNCGNCFEKCPVNAIVRR